MDTTRGRILRHAGVEPTCRLRLTVPVTRRKAFHIIETLAGEHLASFQRASDALDWLDLNGHSKALVETHSARYVVSVVRQP